MSFTSIVKNEVSKLETSEIENIAELSAIIRNVGIVVDDILKISIENSSVARRIYNLIKTIYKVTPKIIVRKGYNFNKTYIYILEIRSKKQEILDDLCIDFNDQKNIPKEYIYSDDEQIRSYLREEFH